MSSTTGIRVLLYRLLRQVLRVGLELYYLDIRAVGRENVPTEGPVIFAANHPNSIMDTVILGTQTPREICYMAKSGLFRNPIVAMLFNSCGVIPVHRNPTGGGGSNEDAFRRAFEVLEEGGAIGIFPEGRNSLEREVLKIKTGTARISLGAEARNGFELGVRVVPVGLNFENRDRFLSSVLVRIGEPIDTREFAKLHAEDDRAAVVALTERIADAIREQATHIEGDQIRNLARDIHRIYGRRLLDGIIAEREDEKRAKRVVFDDLVDGSFDDFIVEDLVRTDEADRGLLDRFFDEMKTSPGRKVDLENELWLIERIAKAIRHFEETDAALFRKVRADIWRYKDHLRQVQLRYDFAERPPETLSRRREALRLTAYTILFALPALWGLLHNAIPYAITRFATMRAPDEAMRAFTGFVVGLFLYPIYYAAIAYAVLMATGSMIWAAVYVCTLPPAGFFFLRYRRQIARFRSRILTRTMFQTERRLIMQVMKEREQLLELFDQLRQRFLAEEDGTPIDEEQEVKSPVSSEVDPGVEQER